MGQGKAQEIWSHTDLLTSCVTWALLAASSLSLSFFNWRVRLKYHPPHRVMWRTKYSNVCENDIVECQPVFKD